MSIKMNKKDKKLRQALGSAMHAVEEGQLNSRVLQSLKEEVNDRLYWVEQKEIKENSVFIAKHDYVDSINSKIDDYTSDNLFEDLRYEIDELSGCTSKQELKEAVKHTQSAFDDLFDYLKDLSANANATLKSAKSAHKKFKQDISESLKK